MRILHGTLKKDLPIPLYYQLKEVILKAINNGDLKIGDCLPTEIQFMESYNISRSTVRQAILELVSEGYLYRQKGKGTFVSPPKIKQSYINKVETYNEQMKRLGIKPKTKILEFIITSPSSIVCKKLNLDSDSKVIKLVRIRYGDNEPIVIVETYLPYKLGNFVMEHDMAVESLYEVLSNRKNTQVIRATRAIEATVANKKEADTLQVEKGHALQVIKTVGCNKDNIPIEYTIAKYRGDRNTFIIETQVLSE